MYMSLKSYIQIVRGKSKLIRNVLSSTIKNIPFIVGKFSDNGYREKVEMLLGENNYNCILVDHLSRLPICSKISIASSIKSA